MQVEAYNGWSSRETWLVGLFLDGNYDGEGTYREVLELTEAHVSDSLEAGRDRDDAVYTLAEALKDLVCEACPPAGGASLADDLLGTAMTRVDWRELAEAKIAEVRS